MTEEIRQKANQLHKEIEDMEARIQILGDMNSSCRSIQIRSDMIGTVTVGAGDYEPAIDYIIDMLKQQKGAKEDEYRLL